MSDTQGPFTLCKDGVKVALRVTPKASRDKIEGLADEADGRKVLKVSVTVVPEDGKANEAVIKLLSKAWHLPRSTITVVLGQTARSKTLLVEGNEHTILLLNDWLAALMSPRR